jgi:hypothetical protein
VDSKVDLIKCRCWAHREAECETLPHKAGISHRIASSATGSHRLPPSPLLMAEAVAVAQPVSRLIEECMSAYLASGVRWQRIRQAFVLQDLISSTRASGWKQWSARRCVEMIGLSARTYVTSRRMRWQLTTGEDSRAALAGHSQLLNPPSPAVRPAIHFTKSALVKHSLANEAQGVHCTTRCLRHVEAPINL